MQQPVMSYLEWTLSTAFRCLRERSTLEDIPHTTEIEYLKQWLADKSKRGIHGFLAAK